ncbi:hypothetical protein LTR37_004258 [Vermiconidia calcicola]|uniref:Uncharacterized protein n=1 Tax=Vermiconidia calcicola TaxID=1690605 RepID=A0ACC3NPJ9_9PEZI|nr:hypothetical protein LTR37_004258 [Vermiconidia calcicola]
MADLGELHDATESTAATAPTTQSSSTTSKRKRKKRVAKPHILSQFTIRDTPWAYVHLQHLNSSNAVVSDLDAVTAHLHLTAALSQFLGLHGAAIPFDILKIEGQDVWIRLPSEDRSALVAAVGGWVSGSGQGWRVKGWSSWNADAMGRKSGQDLFTD